MVSGVNETQRDCADADEFEPTDADGVSTAMSWEDSLTKGAEVEGSWVDLLATIHDSEGADSRSS